MVLSSDGLVISRFQACLGPPTKAFQLWDRVKPRNTGNHNTNGHLTFAEDLALPDAVCLVMGDITSNHPTDAPGIDCRDAV